MSGYRRTGRVRQLAAALFSLVCVCTGSPAATDQSVAAARAAAHAAEAAREGTGIPALSEKQIAAYLDGRAMWMAGVAELHHYPGPRQVLELAGQLGLTVEQRQAVVSLYDEMRPEAVRLGKQLVEQEQRLNRVFAWGQASGEIIGSIVNEIGALQGYGEPAGESGARMGCNAAHHHGRR